MLPARVAPQEDELYYSWVARLALANACEPLNFTRVYQPKLNLWTSCVNGHSKNDISELLSRETGIDVGVINATHTIQFLQRHYVSLDRLNGRNYLLANYARGYTHKRNWLQYCPYCLEGDRHPYFRNKWRVAFIPVCSKHNAILLDSCFKCHSPINFQRLTTFSNELCTCPFCHVDLRAAHTNVLPSAHDLLYFVKLVEEGIDLRWVSLGKDQCIMMPLFLSGLYFIAKPMFKERLWEALAQFFQSNVSEFIALKQEQRKHLSLGRLSIANRVFLFSMLGYLMKAWPDNFSSFCKYMKLNQIAFTIHPTLVPHWLASPLKLNTFSQPYWVSDQEFENAAAYLSKRGYEVTYPNVAEAAGLDRSCHRTQSRNSLLQKHAVNSTNKYPVFHW